MYLERERCVCIYVHISIYSVHTCTYIFRYGMLSDYPLHVVLTKDKEAEKLKTHPNVILTNLTQSGCESGKCILAVYGSELLLSRSIGSVAKAALP